MPFRFPVVSCSRWCERARCTGRLWLQVRHVFLPAPDPRQRVNRAHDKPLGVIPKRLETSGRTLRGSESRRTAQHPAPTRSPVSSMTAARPSRSRSVYCLGVSPAAWRRRDADGIAISRPARPAQPARRPRPGVRGERQDRLYLVSTALSCTLKSNAEPSPAACLRTRPPAPSGLCPQSSFATAPDPNDNIAQTVASSGPRP